MTEQNPGDPSGRRIAAQTALHLSEAGKLIHALKALLTRTGFDCSLCDQLANEIKRQETAAVQKSGGRIDSRRIKKFGTGQPLQDGRTTNLLYIDESGTSAPNPNQPYFALGGIAITQEAADAYGIAADAIKQHFFGRTDITFHEPLMRRNNEIYFFGGDTGKQAAFDQALDELVKNTPFVTLGSAVRKLAFQQEFAQTGIDPYLPTNSYVVAIIMILERYVDFLASQQIPLLGRVLFESLGPKEDAIHQMEYARILIEGTQWVSGSDFRQWLETGLRFQTKCGSNPGELADMFSRDLFEWVSGDCQVTPKRWHLFCEKAHSREDGLRGKFGIKVFPDSDIRDAVMQHRQQYQPLPSPKN